MALGIHNPASPWHRSGPAFWPAHEAPELWARQTRNAPPQPVPPVSPPGTSTPDQAVFAVRVVDNPVNTYQEVIAVCCAALGVSPEEGFAIAQVVDTQGSCVVCQAPEPEARRIAEVIRTIGIEVRLEPAGDSAPLSN